METEDRLSRDADSPGEVWIRLNLGRIPTRHEILVCGARVSYRVWRGQRPGARCIVLLHGNAARSEWWDAIGPSLTTSADVVALDLSGHGDSDWRAEYGFDDWAAEVVAVLDHESYDEVTLVGHSMGGLVGLWTSWKYPERISRLGLIDTPFRRFTDEERAKRSLISRRMLPRHRSRAEAISNFKTTPVLRQRRADVWNHVAESSFRRDPEGWVLHFDPALYSRVTEVDDFLRSFPPGTAILRADEGLLPREMVAQMRGLLEDADRVATIEGAGHNVILEKPEEVSRWVREVVDG